MLSHSKTSSSQPDQRIYVDEVWCNNFGQQGPGREWTEWRVYGVDTLNPLLTEKTHFTYEDRDSAIVNACQWAQAIGETTIQLQKEGKNTEEIGIDKPSRKVHLLKIWPQYLDPIGNLEKTFEVRRNDRDFRVGDILHLREWFPDKNEWGARNITCFVTFILEGPAFGIEAGYCVMSIKMPANHQWPPC